MQTYIPTYAVARHLNIPFPRVLAPKPTVLYWSPNHLAVSTGLWLLAATDIYAAKQPQCPKSSPLSRILSSMCPQCNNAHVATYVKTFLASEKFPFSCLFSLKFHASREKSILTALEASVGRQQLSAHTWKEQIQCLQGVPEFQGASSALPVI